MGGKNSGRRPKIVEMHERETAKEVLKLSLHTIVGVLRDESLPVDLRLKAAIPFGQKYFPDKVEINDVNALTHDERLAIGERVAGLVADKLSGFKVVDVQEG